MSGQLLSLDQGLVSQAPFLQPIAEALSKRRSRPRSLRAPSLLGLSSAGLNSMAFRRLIAARVRWAGQLQAVLKPEAALCQWAAGRLPVYKAARLRLH